MSQPLVKFEPKIKKPKNQKAKKPKTKNTDLIFNF